jgi:hypothetical protein
MEYQIKGIDILSFTLIPPQKEVSTQVFFYDFHVEYRLDVENSVLMVITAVTVKSDDQETQLGSLTTGCVYAVNPTDFQKIVERNGNAAKVKEEYMEEFYMESLATTRGLMFAQFRGTPLHYAFLPIIQPEELMKNLA